MRPDLPFSPEVVAYMGKRLRALDIEPDRSWVDPHAGDEFDMFILHSHSNMLKAARKALPQSRAQWEMADFYRFTIPPAVFDLNMGVITRYPEFAFLYERLLGTAAKPWLRSIFLAAAASPTFTEECRVELVGRFAIDHLRFDAEEELPF